MKKKSLGIIWCTFMIVMLLPILAYALDHGYDKKSKGKSESDCKCSINDFKVHFMNEDLKIDTVVCEQGETVHSIQVSDVPEDSLSLKVEGSTQEINCPKGVDHTLTYKFKKDSSSESYQTLESEQQMNICRDTVYTFKVSAEGIATHHYIYVKFVSSTAETQPSIQIDYANEKLKGFVDDGTYTVNGNEVTIVEGDVAIDNSWFGTEISIIKKGDGTTTMDSTAQLLTIPDRPEKPSAPIQVSKTKNSIIITNTSDFPNGEFSIDQINWKEDATFTGLNSGTTYKVYARVKATEHSFCSHSTMVTTVTDGTSLGKGTILGTIMNESSSKMSGVTVKVTKNGTNGVVLAETTSDAEGKYTFKELSYGVYSLVVTKEEQTVTKTIRVNKPSIIQDITLLSGKKDTLVEVKGTTPPVAADNLDKMFSENDKIIANTGTVKIKLVVEKKEQNSIPPDEKSKVEARLSSGKKIGLYLDAQLLKTITGTVDKNVTDELIQPPDGQKVKITMDIPTQLQNKAPYSIIRVHNGVAIEITPQYDNILQTLTFEADKFSTYAITYTDASSSSSSRRSSRDDYDEYIITAKVDKGGSIFPSGDISVREGKDETFTIKPQKGYIIKDVLVNGKSVGAVESYVFRDVQSKHTIKAIFEEELDKNLFKDIKQEDWFYHDILEVYKNGFMQGVSETEFAPNLTTSRGMIATIVYRLDGSTEKIDSKFADVAKDQYYYNPIGWAEKYDIVKGYGNGMYGPNDTVNREQLIAILWRYAGSPMLMDYKGLTEFSDASEISKYAQPAMAWAHEKGIISGKGNNILDPKGLATRAQLAKIIVNFTNVK